MVFMSKFQSVLFYNLKSCQKYFKSSTNCIILRETEGLITQKRSCLIAILSANTCASVRVFLDPQGLQNNLERESSSLQDLESQKQDAQVRLEEMDQQRSRLEGMLNDIKQKCQDETQKVRDVTLKWCACISVEECYWVLCLATGDSCTHAFVVLL